MEPSAPAIPGLAESNRALMGSYAFAIGGMDVQELRSRLRRSLCGGGGDGPTLVTGHQPTFFHAGVWAKHVVASLLAKRHGGTAIDLIVDSDAPDNTDLEVPIASASGLEVGRVSCVSVRPGVAHEGIPRPAAERIEAMRNSVRELMGPSYDRSCMGEYFNGLLPAAPGDDWVDQVMRARAAVERSFGVQVIQHRVSRVWFGPVLADLLLNAGRFMQCYNAALGDYRRANRVRSPHRPIPDLASDGTRCELPIWVFRPAEPRRRLFIDTARDRVCLWAEEQRLGEVSTRTLQDWDTARHALDHLAGFVFRPRALTLTLWARLLLADLFIHGIGGAKYDRITDGLIRRFYGVQPPAMACVSATLLMDLPHDEADHQMVREARARVRDIRYNPQRHARPSPETEALSAERRRAVADSLALKSRSPRDRAGRRLVFDRIRGLNDRFLELDGSVLTEASARVDTLKRRLERNRLAGRRDYFFAMLDRTRLQQLCGRLSAALPNAES